MVSNVMYTNETYITTEPKIFVNPKTNLIYINQESMPFITVLNGSTNKIMDYVKLDKSSHSYHDMAIDENASLIYLLNGDSSSTSNNENPAFISGPEAIVIINGTINKIIDRIPLVNVASSDAIDFNPRTHILYLVSHDSKSLTSINATSHQILPLKK